MPTPKPDEKQNDFISRCMAYPDMQKYDSKQRSAICYSVWKEHKKKSKASVWDKFVDAMLKHRK